MKNYLLLFCALFLGWHTSYGQSRTVGGTVTSAEDNEPLPGVSVLVKGTTSGTATDLDGRFALEIPTDNAVLVVSYIGFVTKEMPVGNQSNINISLEADLQQLQEIVVTGYGSQIKREVTGAISSVKGSDLNRVPMTSMDASLQGMASGIQVSQAAGTPGAPARVMVRGTSSITSSTEPLWIIDGLPISNPVTGGIGGQGGPVPLNPLANLNPNDIESIEVLKDAAATAIYGSRGSNGVILVTTKSGQKGQKGKFTIDVQQGVSDLTRRPSDVGFANGDQWLDLVEQGRANSGLPPYDVNNILNQGRDPNAVLDRSQYANTNWFDQILRTGSFTDLNVSTSQGFEKGSFFISGQYRKDQGVMKTNDFERASLRVNSDFEPVRNLNLGTRLSFSYVNNDRVRTNDSGAPGGNNNTAQGGFGAANSIALPILPIYHPTVTRPDGSATFFDPLSGRNPVATLDRNNLVDNAKQYRGIGGVFADYKIGFIEGLSVRTELSIDYMKTSALFWANTNLRAGSSYAFQESQERRNVNYNLYGTYNKTLGAHRINVVFGTESQYFSGENMFIEGEQLNGVLQQVGSPNNPIRLGGSLGVGERKFRGVFGRFNYVLNDKYLLGASLRRDGLSSFIVENRYATFAALSAGWIVSEEAFMQNFGFIDLLKFRGSFGQTGNQEIPNLQVDGFTGWSRYGSRDALVGAGDNLSRIGVPGLTWETTNSYDVGVDFELFRNRVTGSFGYYRQDIVDMILAVPIAQSSGLFATGNSIFANIGDMRNEGIELNISTINIDKGDFRWSTTFNFTTNRNKIVSLEPSLDAAGTGVTTGNTISRTGGRLGAFFMNRYAGIDPNTGVELIYALDRAHLSETGQYRQLVDASGNPVIIPASRGNTDNNRFLEDDKTGLPTFFGGLSNTFTYKAFDLNVMFSFQGGNWIYDESERAQTNIGDGTGVLRSGIIGNTWTPQNPNAKYPELRWNYRYDIDNAGETAAPNSQRYDIQRPLDRYAYRGDFIRLRALQLGYNLPPALLSKLSIQNARVYIAGNNLFTIRDRDFNGYDVEAINLSGDAQQRNLNQGFIGAQIPQLRMYSIGASLTF